MPIEKIDPRLRLLTGKKLVKAVIDLVENHGYNGRPASAAVKLNAKYAEVCKIYEDRKYRIDN